jgi:type I restriction-modification system DNA methylase subunit
MDIVKIFLNKVSETYNSGHATEHSYRPALQELFEKITELKVHNEPKRSEFGAPDFVFTKGKTVVAYAEAKDINISLDEIEKSEQMVRYYGYSNIILTNGLDFRFYRNAVPYGDSVVIGKLNKEGVEVFEGQFQLLADTIGSFIKESKEPIKSGTVLSKVMAGKARRIRDNVKKFLEDDKNSKNENLLGVYEVIKKLLLADLDHAKFADMYAQTLVYGLFVARFNDKTQENFSRQEARDLIPPSNPFLREFFNHIAGSSFDDRIEYIVNELCEEFNHADVREIIHKYYKTDLFGKIHESKDPIIHFYEDFLQEYDPAERKKMGVFYTPLPVVRFIVRAVDDILKKEFDLPQGLADNTKIDVVKEIQGMRHKVPVHKVQVLDPATGTGTFLNEAILHIKKSFEGQEGRWSSYVNADLLPRMHGFELMMASYTIAHLKLSSTIAESGAKIENTRLGVYLTNSLEKAEVEEKTLFDIGLGKAITEESNQANKVKNELPIMVVMGNPPYSLSSQNKGEWIQDLIKEYKKDLNERKINLDDDYIKFIRLSESLIEKNGSGIVAMITNNSFIDGVTHRQMRKHLLETFDSIYIVDLHGSSKKKEKAPNGGKDENVFNIMQGVSINIFMKKEGKKKGLGTVYHTELYGKREDKFETLNNGDMESIKWNKLNYSEPYYFFVPKDFSANLDYEKGFKVDDLFAVSNSGVKTDRDELFIDNDSFELENRIKKLLGGGCDDAFCKNYRVIDSGSYKLTEKIKGKYFTNENIQEIQYRPFDYRYIYYDSKIISRPGFSIFKHTFAKKNILLCTSRSIPQNQDFDRVLVSKDIIDIHSASDQTYAFPLYLYAEDGSKVSNLKKEIVDEVEKVVGKVTPEDVFDYIYAVLYSPSYREKYKEFLKIDFPRVPYPKDKELFEVLVAIGKELRELHLMESPKLKNLITTFPEAGNDMIEVKYPKYKDGKVYINEKQYFGGIPEVAWNFYIGGYQPAQKWLKDRKGKKLLNEDIEHYQKIVVVLSETARIMGEIDNIIKF